MEGLGLARSSLRRVHVGGGAAAVVAAAFGFFLLADLRSDAPAWASPTRGLGAALTGGQPLPAAAAGGVQEKAAASSLIPARPFHLSALDQTSTARAEQCLAEAIYYEAASESDEGQRAVAQVVLNRVRHGAFPNSICGVVYQGSERSTGCQFTFTCDGSLSRRPSHWGWARAVRIAREALRGAVFSPVGHATHYHAAWMRPYWAPSVALVGQIGGHIFYSMKGAVGSAAAFNQAYSGLESPTVRLAQAEEVPVPTAELGLVELPAPLSEKSEAKILADPANADLLNFRTARDERPAKLEDEMRVASTVEAALE